MSECDVQGGHRRHILGHVRCTCLGKTRTWGLPLQGWRWKPRREWREGRRVEAATVADVQQLDLTDKQQLLIEEDAVEMISGLGRFQAISGNCSRSYV